MEQAIKLITQNALKELYQANIQLEQIKIEPTNPDFVGDYTLLAFPFSRFSKVGPEETANQLGVYFSEHLNYFESFNVVKGFLNIKIKTSYWIEQFKSFDLNFETKNENIMVEYSSPNTNKPLHLGHIRNNLLGFSVAQILKLNGFDVKKVNLINDRGIHICKSMLAWKLYGNQETPESTGLKGDHLVGKYYVEFDKNYKNQILELEQKGIDKKEAEKQAPLMLQAQEMLREWEKGNPEVLSLWQTMNQWVYDGFSKTYKQLGVDFDKYYYESNTYLSGKDIVEEGLKRNIFFKKEDGSVWIDLSADGLDEKLVLRSDGTSVYMTQDIGTAILKYNEFKSNKSIYVVGNEQDYHFKVLFLILEKLGFEWAKGLYHLSYGMVDLPSGKMKSREGTVVDADDLMQEMIETAKQKTEELGKTEGLTEEQKNELYEQLGMGALKFFMLKVDPAKRMLFNPQESIDFQGDTGPFVQYAYARIKSMLRVAQPEDLLAPIALEDITKSETNLIKVILEFPNELNKASQNYSPAVIAHYVLELAKAFNRVYTEVSLLREPNHQKRQFRLQLSKQTAELIQTGMGLLGISCPEKM